MLIHSWTNFRNIILNKKKKSQIQNTNSVWFHCCEILGSSITVLVIESRPEVAWGGGGKRAKRTFQHNRKRTVFFGGSYKSA